jgi:hypothetical protein
MRSASTHLPVLSSNRAKGNCAQCIVNGAGASIPGKFVLDGKGNQVPARVPRPKSRIYCTACSKTAGRRIFLCCDVEESCWLKWHRGLH